MSTLIRLPREAWETDLAEYTTSSSAPRTGRGRQWRQALLRALPSGVMLCSMEQSPDSNATAGFPGHLESSSDCELREFSYCPTSAVKELSEEDVRVMESEDFLETLYARVAAGEVSTAMDSVIDHIDRLLNDEMYTVCDHLLWKVELKRLPSSIRRAFLMMTRPAKDRLPARRSVYHESLRLLADEKGADRASQMLKALA